MKELPRWSVCRPRFQQLLHVAHATPQRRPVPSVAPSMACSDKETSVEEATLPPVAPSVEEAYWRQFHARIRLHRQPAPEAAAAPPPK